MVSLMDRNEAKLKFHGLAKAALVLGTSLDLDLIAIELDTSVQMLKTWLTEINKMADSEAIIGLLELDHEISDEAASQDLEKAVTDDMEDRVEIIGGKITVIKAEDATKAQNKSLTAREFKDGVAGLNLLSEELQGTAGTLIQRIAFFADKEDSQLTPRDLASLTSALTNLQNAFFNKPTTHIQVGVVNGQGESLLSRFQGRLSP